MADITERLNVRNGDKTDRVLTVAAGAGLVDQQTYFTKKVASSNLTNYLRVEPDDLVYNKSSSKDAPFGVVAMLRGSGPGVVTPLYFVFRARGDLVLPEYLELACNSAHFFSSLSGMLREGARSHGALNVRLQEFFDAQVHLPPLEEQHQAVSVLRAIDELSSAQTAESARVADLLHATREEAFAELWRTSDLVRFDELVAERKRPVAVAPDSQYHQIGVRSHGRGVFFKDSVSGEELGAKKIFCVLPDDLVINIVFAWEGAVAVVPADAGEVCASHRFPTYVPLDDGPVEFLRQLLISTRGLEALSIASPGGAGRNRTLNRRRLAEVLMPRPSRDVREDIVERLSALEVLLSRLENEHRKLVTLRRQVIDGLGSGQLAVSGGVRRLNSRGGSE